MDFQVYIDIFVEWFMETLWPNIIKNFEDMISKIMGIFGDFDFDFELPF